MSFHKAVDLLLRLSADVDLLLNLRMNANLESDRK